MISKSYTIIHPRLSALMDFFHPWRKRLASIHWCRIVSIKSQYRYTRRMGSPKDARLSWHSCTRVLRAMICSEGWILRMLGLDRAKLVHQSKEWRDALRGEKWATWHPYWYVDTFKKQLGFFRPMEPFIFPSHNRITSVNSSIGALCQFH